MLFQIGTCWVKVYSIHFRSFAFHGKAVWVFQELYESASQEVTGPLASAHQWVNMTDVTVWLNSTHTVSVTESSWLCATRKDLWADLIVEVQLLFLLFVFIFFSFRQKHVNRPWATALQLAQSTALEPSILIRVRCSLIRFMVLDSELQDSVP